MFIKTDSDGRILATVSTSPLFADVYPDLIWIDTGPVHSNDYYVSERQILPRPDPESTPSPSAASIPADGSTTLIVSNIPVGAWVQVSGPVEDEWTEESGSCELSVDIPGFYTLKIEKWPQKSVEVSFNAT